MKRKKNKCGSKERWRTCVFTDSWRRDLPEETQQYRLLWKSQQDEDQDKGGSHWWPYVSYGKRLFIVLCLQPPSSLSPDPHFPSPSPGHLPLAILWIVQTWVPQNCLLFTPAPNQTDRQTPDSFTCSPHPPRLHHHPPKLSIVPESFPPPAYARVADPLNISLTNLSSLTLRLQP